MKKDILYVAAHFLLFALYFVDWQILNLGLGGWMHYVFLSLVIIGLLLVVLGILSLNANFSPFPTPKSNASLISHGIYKYVRHPVYSGIILSLFAYAFFSNSAFRVVITIALVALFYLKTNLEEKLLRARFPDYKQYMQQTGRFFPKQRK